VKYAVLYKITAANTK